MNNEDKILDFVEKIYMELQDAIGELKALNEETNTKLNGLESEIKSFRKDTGSRFEQLESKLRLLKP